MTKSEFNPWALMPESSKRRVDVDIERNLFWITDLQGNYGFCIESPLILVNAQSSANLKGITVVKRISQKGTGELFLVLTNKDDWQIFKTLCDDLIDTGVRCRDDAGMIEAIEIRLKRWQHLLRQDTHIQLTIEAQMGLFSELLCLKDVLGPIIGVPSAIAAWVGPDKDKQDFLTDNASLEVKSYRTSKGPFVAISSIYQLWSEKKFAFLISYGLTPSENGISVEDLVLTCKQSLFEASQEISDTFESKLIAYGFIPEIIKEPLTKFLVDSKRIHEIKEQFPRINPQHISSEIVSVKYSLNLGECGEFEVSEESITI
jgi:hypothetical protein